MAYTRVPYPSPTWEGTAAQKFHLDLVKALKGHTNHSDTEHVNKVIPPPKLIKSLPHPSKKKEKPSNGQMDLFKESIDLHKEEMFSKQELGDVNTYILGKNELEKPRELSEEEKHRIHHRKLTGWTWNNPIESTKKMDATQIIQNPVYRATFDTLTQSLSGAVGGAQLGLGASTFMSKNPTLRKSLIGAGIGAVAGTLPSALSIIHNYKKQHLYNDIAETYIKHHPEGQIASMPEIIKETLDKPKTVSSLKIPNKKVIKHSAEKSVMHDPFFMDAMKPAVAIQTGLGILNMGNQLYKGINNFGKGHLELNDLKDRLEQKLKKKQEAEVFLTKVKTPIFKKHYGQEEKIRDFDELFKTSAVDKLLESLSDQEHKQWAKWTRYFIDNYNSKNVIKWEKQIATPYSDLSEKEKNSDREWAQKVLKIVGHAKTSAVNIHIPEFLSHGGDLATHGTNVTNNPQSLVDYTQKGQSVAQVGKDVAPVVNKGLTTYAPEVAKTVGKASPLLESIGTIAEKSTPPVAALGLALNAGTNLASLAKGQDVAGNYAKTVNSNVLPDTGGNLNPLKWNNYGMAGNVASAISDPTGALGTAMRGSAELGGTVAKGLMSGTNPFSTEPIPANNIASNFTPSLSGSSGTINNLSTPNPVSTISPPNSSSIGSSFTPSLSGSSGTSSNTVSAGSTPTIKTSVDKDPMLEHQQRVVDRLSQPDQPGLIVMHSLGSGKSKTSLEAYKKLKLPTEVILPASLKGNYEKEIHKWVGKKPKDLNIVSQQNVARNGLPEHELDGKLMIIDEAHRLRNEDTSLYKNLKEQKPAKRLLLTGSPIYNKPSDISKLINLAAGKDILPEREAEFSQEYIGQRVVFPSLIHRALGFSPGQEQFVKNPEYLRKVFHKMIDFHGGTTEGYPEVKEETIKVPMGDDQQKVYKAIMKTLPWHTRLKVSAGLPADRKELDKLIPFLSGSRMISNTSRGFKKDEKEVQSPKIDAAVKFLVDKMKEDPEYKGVVYSNYLNSGINEYAKKLDENKVPYARFTGDETNKVRDQNVKDYNIGKIKALLLTGAGGEGLDLRSSSVLQILEPHFNNPRLDQVRGRVARYHSHEGLPKDKQQVLIQKYLSTLNPGMLDKIRHRQPVSSDEYLQNLSDQKTRLNNEFIDLIKN